MTKCIAKKSATPKPAAAKKPAIAKKAKKTAPVVGSSVEVNAILERMNSKVKLTDDAVQLLNAYITSLFTTIAQKAETIVKKA